MKPLVSVVMPVYNCERFVSSAIDSILNQSYTNFEFIIIDDGSTDKTPSIIKSYKDKRIVYIRNEQNLRIVNSLNKGIDRSEGEYILRMDADDISVHTRIAEQVRFMELNRETGVLGTSDIAMNTYFPRIRPKPLSWQNIKFQLLFDNPVVHPSVIMRKSFIRQYSLLYDNEFTYSEDFDLWTKCADHFKIINLKKPLIKYRISKSSLSREKASKTNELNRAIVRRQLKKMNLDPSESQLDLHMGIWLPKNSNLKDYLNAVESWFLELTDANCKTNYLDNELFFRYLSERWINICLANISSGYQAYIKMKQSVLFTGAELTLRDKIRKIMIYNIKRYYYKSSNQFGMR